MRILLWMAIALIGASAPAAAEALVFASVRAPGLIDNGNDGVNVSGIAYEVLHKVAQRAGVTDSYKIFPFARVLETVKATPGMCALGVPRLDAIVASYKWAGPIIRQTTMLYVRADDAIVLHDARPIAGKTLGALRNSGVAERMKGLGWSVDEASDSATNLRKLVAGRIDLWAVNDLEARAAFIGAEPPLPRPAFAVGTIEGYMACHPSVSAGTIKRLDDAIHSLRAEGEFRALGL
jgi:polar amino acid transport system substrate-binding protein